MQIVIKHKKNSFVSRYCSSSSRLKRTPTATPIITPAINKLLWLEETTLFSGYKRQQGQQGVWVIWKSTSPYKKCTGIYATHTNGRMMARQMQRAGYFQLTKEKDCIILSEGATNVKCIATKSIRLQHLYSTWCLLGPLQCGEQM